MKNKKSNPFLKKIFDIAKDKIFDLIKESIFNEENIDKLKIKLSKEYPQFDDSIELIVKKAVEHKDVIDYIEKIEKEGKIKLNNYKNKVIKELKKEDLENRQNSTTKENIKPY